MNLNNIITQYKRQNEPNSPSADGLGVLSLFPFRGLRGLPMFQSQ